MGYENDVLWSHRQVTALDGIIEVYKSKQPLLSDEFMRDYVHKQQPVIASFEQPEKLGKWAVAELIKTYPNIELNNIVMGDNNGRFTFHSEDENSSINRQQHITLRELQERSEERLYVYGGHLPDKLRELIPHIQCLDKVKLTSSLLWLSFNATCSPLHFDLTCGLLFQMSGKKRIIIIAPTYEDRAYIHSKHSLYDRQSRIDCIHTPDLNRFPAFDNVPALQGTISAGQFVFIPYGWLHQIESDSGGSVSISFRFNPYENSLRSAALVRAQMMRSGLPTNSQEAVCSQILEGVPSEIQNIFLKRLNTPHI